ncbi:hypothetical protein ACHAWF_001193, partial [Thalassiosira exigua]
FEWGICTSCSSWELRWVCQRRACGLISTSTPSTKWDYISQNIETIYFCSWGLLMTCLCLGSIWAREMQQPGHNSRPMSTTPTS